MVQRDSQLNRQAVNPNRQVQLSSAGRVNPDVNKFRKAASTSESILQAILPAVEQIAGVAAQKSREDAYLDGVRQAASLESEDALESNPFTSAWTKAGFRDTKGRQARAKFADDLPAAIENALRQEDPRKAFDEWQAQRQRELTAQYSSMSRAGRQESFVQLVPDIMAAQKTFDKEYRNHVIRTEVASISKSINASVDLLDRNRDDVEAYLAATESMVASVYSSIWLNEKLPEENKVQLTQQALEFAASTDHEALYRMMKEVEYDFPDGSKSTIMAKLPLETQEKLSFVRRQVLDRTAAIRGADFRLAMGQRKVAWEKNPPTESWDEIDGMLKEAMAHNLVTPDYYEGIVRAYFESIAQNGTDSGVAQAYATGQLGKILNRGKTEQQAFKAWASSLGDIPLEQRVQTYLQAGVAHGWETAFAGAGEAMAPVFAVLGFDTEINSENALAANQYIRSIEEAERQNPGAAFRILQGMPEDARWMANMMRQGFRRGNTDPNHLTAWAREQIVTAKKAGPSRPAQLAKAHSDDAKARAAYLDKGMVGGALNSIASLFSTSSRVRKQLTEADVWFDNDYRIAENRAIVNNALAEEQALIRETYGAHFDADTVLEEAAARVANRLVPVGQARLVLPAGQDIYSAFGVPQSTDPEYLGQTLESMVGVPEGGYVRVVMAQHGQGVLVERYGEGNEPLGTQVIPNTAVRDAVEERLTQDADKMRLVVGPGKTVSKDGISINFNGMNTAGVAPVEMYAFREEMVNRYGLPNKETNGYVGPGIRKHSRFLKGGTGRDGTYSQTNIAETFRLASSEAMETADKIMRGVGLDGASTRHLIADLAYQDPKAAKDSKLIAALTVGNAQAAEQALRENPAFKDSPPEIQAARLRKLREALQE